MRKTGLERPRSTEAETINHCQTSNIMRHDDLWNLPNLRAATENVLLNFLQADLALCFTFADRLKSELRIGNWNAARKVLAEAEKGHATIARFLPRGTDVKPRNEIKRRMNDLRTILDSAHREMRQAE